MALTTIEYGALASSEVMNNNFEYLDNRITSVNNTVTSNNSSILSNLASINTSITNAMDTVRPIGQPILRLDNTLLSDEIRLEGATVSRTTYADLFEIYGVTYGSGDGTTTFQLPDFRDRVLWGAENFGYLSATLPNIKGGIDMLVTYKNSTAYSGAFYTSWSNTWKKSGTDQTLWNSDMLFDASRSSSVYQDNASVRPASVQIRVVTRYK